MTDKSASKLRTLLTSVIVISAFYAIFFPIYGSFSAYWYDLSLDEVREYRTTRYLDFQYTIGFFSLPILWWHAFDFIGEDKANSSKRNVLLSYKLAASFLVLGLLGAAVIYAGVIEVIACWHPEPKPTESGSSFGFFCTPSVGGGMLPLVILPAFLLLILAIIKTVWAISSILKGPE